MYIYIYICIYIYIPSYTKHSLCCKRRTARTCLHLLQDSGDNMRERARARERETEREREREKRGGREGGGAGGRERETNSRGALTVYPATP